MLAFALALGLLANACPMKIGIARNGAVFSNRMEGWYRTSQKTLEVVLRGGCYNDANPSEITSVNLVIAPNAPKQRVIQVFFILEKTGWPKDKVKLDTWTNDPKTPR
jgi:hypothetical protein